MTNLTQFFEKVQSKFADLKILSLTTADGFSIYCHVNNRFHVEDEKVAAVSSSLISLSNAAAQQMMGHALESTTIETGTSNMFLCNTQYNDKKCVLCIVTGVKENIGHARYFTKQIAQLVSKQ
ncbi:roadblock/LC7 domain-containing protein [Marinicella rhabdoformis]|uniref:roadblock/LC7 domain-containing protein n=1 Tax=Marinicella rhabdoformis TaxID=2580566 RepID=UPI0012AEB481|nr:hypothetical protein [Marinicella rhabdoformis]